MSFPQYMALKKGPLPLCLFTLHQKRPLYLTHATQKLYLLKAILFCLEVCFCVKVHFVLKLFNFTLLFVNTLKLLKGPLWYICLRCFEKHMTCSGGCSSRVVYQLSNKARQKLRAKASEGPRDISEKRGPRDDSIVHLP